MKIYVFKRPGGSLWADLADLGARPDHERVTEYLVSTRSQAKTLMQKPGEFVPERVAALAERVFDELTNQEKDTPVTRQQHDLAVAQVQKWGFGRRLKWLFTGKADG